MKFKYFKKTNDEVQNIDLIQEILTIGGKSVVLDSEYLPLIEMAENRDITAAAELAEAFWYGKKGLSQNYSLAEYYCKIMLCDSRDDPKIELEALTAIGSMEYDFGNYEKAVEYLRQANIVMLVKLEIEDWKERPIKELIKSIEALLKED